jgi:hypothetical protein
MLKRKTEPLEDLINQGLIANQKIPLPKKSNENVTGSYLEYPEENIEYGSNINYPNPYSEGEFFTPDNVSLGQQNIRKNIPLSLGMAQPTSMPRSMPMSIPSIEEPQQEDSTNFLGSLLSQGAAMLGAGVRGGDVGQVGRMFDLNRQEAFRQGQYQKQKAEQKQKIKEQENTAKQYVDPNSEISIQERAKARELYGDAISDKFSYADLQNRFVREAIEKKYNAIQEQKNLEEQKGLQSRLDDPKSPETLRLKNSLKLLGINVPEGLSYNEIEKNRSRLEKLSEPKPMIGGGVRGGVRQEKPEKEKKNPFQKEINQINIAADNGLQALDELEKLIKQKGTTEFFGSTETKINQLTSDIAKAKTRILDPNSVISPLEAQAVKEDLGLGGMGRYITSDKTAIEGIQSFKKLLQNNRNNALKAYYNLPRDLDFNEKDQFILDQYRNNPNDPEIQEAYQNMMKSKGL